MEEKTSLLLNQYCDYHSGNPSHITEESLLKQSRVYLSSVKPKHRFVLLNSDSYTNVLEKVATNLEGKEESFQKIQSGFKSLEQYGINLWKFPWRKEYHAIKLYTAFFKCNIEQQLQDTEAIFDILQSLGYTVKGQQEVSIREPDRDRAIQISLELFLVQVDLQMIKEIIDHFPESEYTLKDIMEARFRKRDVEGAITYLKTGKVTKRRKIEEPQGDDAPSHGHVKSTHTGLIDTFNNVHSDSTPSDAEASADQIIRRKPKRTVLSKGRDDVAADTDDSSSGSAFSKRKPSGGTPAEDRVTSGNTGMRYHPRINSQQFGQVTDQDLYGVSPERSQSYGATHQSFDACYSTVPPAWSSNGLNKLNYDARYSTVPVSGSQFEVDQYNQDPRYGTFPQTGPSAVNTEGSQTYHRVLHAGRPRCPDDTKDRMYPAMTTSHSVSHHETVTPLHPTSQYSSERCVGSDTRGHAVVAKRITVLPSNEVISDANGYHSKNSPRTDTGIHGSASGDARYANVQDASGHGGPKFGSDESCRLTSAKDSAIPCGVREVKYGQTGGTSPSEPMEVGQTEYSRDGRNDATSLYNGMTGVYGRPTAHSVVKDLNATLRHQLILDPSAGLADKDSKQISKVSSEHKRQYGSEPMASAKELTASGGGTTGHAQPPRLLFQTGSSSTCDKDTGEKTRINAADTTSHTTEKREARGSSPLPSRRTSAQREMNPSIEAQTPGHSSRINRPPSTKPAVSQGSNAPNMDGKVDICDFCTAPGTSICQNCYQFVCGKCKEYYNTDLCENTKGQHKFKDLKKSIQTQHRKSELSGQNFEHVDQSIRNDGQDWPCSRCTFLNPPDHTVCSMCAATRGVGPVELTQAGSRVCRNCTFHNEENAKVCSACHKTLDLHPSETSV